MAIFALLAIIVFALIGFGGFALWMEHERKMAQIRYQGAGRNDNAVAEVLESLRSEVAELRDTTTKYDLSFDSALQRMESRIGTVEQRVVRIEHIASVSVIDQHER